jgi:putative ABC transport system permease protein
MPDPSTSSGLRVRARLRAAFASTSIDEDILEELAQHAESTYDAQRADGASEIDALADVDRLIEGWRTDPTSLQRVIRRSVAVVPPSASRSIASGALADANYGLRLLRAKPGYAAVTILTIALGVGAVTTLFSVAYGVLLRPLPWGNTERVVRLSESRGGRQGRVPGTMMNGSYLAWADAPQTLEAIGYYSGASPATLTGVGEATRVQMSRVTPSTIALLEVSPIRGRIFEAGEGRSQLGQSSVVLISYPLWEQRFALRDDIAGQPIVIDGTQHEIVGVMPREFRFPSAEVRVWLAWQPPPVDGPNGTKSGTIMRAIARVKPGVTLAQASAEGTARATAAPDAGPLAMALFGAREPIQITATDATEAAAADVRPAIVILLIASVLLFVTAIGNVANMQLARATARHRELTIRAALGAGTGRLARQLLIENAIVGVLGSAAGLALTVALHAALPSLLPAGFPRVDAIEVDARVMAFTLMLSVITTLVCGVLPLMHARRLEIARSLSDGSGGSAGTGRGRIATVRALIVASQVAVTCVLVIGGMLLARSFSAHLGADRGYDPDNLLTAAIPFPATYKPDREFAALERIVARVGARPGVTHAAASSALPLVSSGGFLSFKFRSPLRSSAEVDVEAIRRIVSPAYFGALGIRVRAGRPLTEADDATAPSVVVVNRSFVRKYLDDVPVERAVGLSLGGGAFRSVNQADEGPAPDITIAGVVDDVKQDGPDGAPQPEVFIAFAQISKYFLSQAFVVMRTVDDPGSHVEALRSALREEDPALALDTVMTMDQRVGLSLSRPRLYAVLFAGFAVFALVIAGAGLFGVLSHSVSQRSRELAVRTALGASRPQIIGVALKQMGVAMIAGLAIGLGASAALSNNLTPFVYGVSARDWISYGVAPIVLLMVGVIACVVPARRVAQTDPVQVLREI